MKWKTSSKKEASTGRSSGLKSFCRFPRSWYSVSRVDRGMENRMVWAQRWGLDQSPLPPIRTLKGYILTKRIQYTSIGSSTMSKIRI